MRQMVRLVECITPVFQFDIHTLRVCATFTFCQLVALEYPSGNPILLQSGAFPSMLMNTSPPMLLRISLSPGDAQSAGINVSSSTILCSLPSPELPTVEGAWKLLALPVHLTRDCHDAGALKNRSLHPPDARQ